MSEIEHNTPTPATVPVKLGKSDQNLVWLDCEMSGLDPEKERLLEIAVVITSPDLSVRVESPVYVIHQSDTVNRAFHPNRQVWAGDDHSDFK